MIEDVYCCLKFFVVEVGLDEGEVIFFVFENFDGIIDEEGFLYWLCWFNFELDGCKK